MPRSCASMMPRLTPLLAPKSSALTITYLAAPAPAAVAPVSIQTPRAHTLCPPTGRASKLEFPGQRHCLGQPILLLIRWRRPFGRPSDVLNGEVQPAAVEQVHEVRPRRERRRQVGQGIVIRAGERVALFVGPGSGD